MNSICYLPTVYWGPIQYYSKLIHYAEIFIEQHETYPKQTYRNRMLIGSANGIQSLQVPVVKGSNKSILLKDIQISYADNWQKNHFKSIESSYRSAPYYEFYIDEVEPFYTKQFKYLIDLNNEILETTQTILDFDANINWSKKFELKISGDDFRFTLHPKMEKNESDKNFNPIKYFQVFEQKYDFIPNLSILDLIFNAGPEALMLIKQSYSI